MIAVLLAAAALLGDCNDAYPPYGPDSATMRTTAFSMVAHLTIAFVLIISVAVLVIYLPAMIKLVALGLAICAVLLVVVWIRNRYRAKMIACSRFRHRRLLGSRREPPRNHCADQRNDVTPQHCCAAACLPEAIDGGV
jgi:small-conductance mechanosensitive channel